MTEYVQKVVRINKRDAERFDELFPQQGSWTWFIRGCLSHALAYHEETADESLDNIVTAYLSKHSRPEEE